MKYLSYKNLNIFSINTILLAGIFFISVGAEDQHHYNERVDIDRPHRPHQSLPPAQKVRPGIAPVPAQLPSEKGPIELDPEVYPENKQPAINQPYQGTTPKIHKKKPLHLQDEGNLMSHPMPQRNPGPSSVHIDLDKPRQWPVQRKKDR